MTWKQKILDTFKHVVFLATATNGLPHDKASTMLALSLVRYDDGVRSEKTLFNLVDDEQHLLSAEYHQIPRELALEKGIYMPVFADEVGDELEQKDCVCFTYNVPFQQEFLKRLGVVQEVLLDFSAIVKGAESGVCEKAKTFAELLTKYSQHVRTAPFSRFAQDRGVPTDARGALLPVQLNARCLDLLFQQLDKLPAPQLGS